VGVPTSSPLPRLGIKRMARNLWHISGWVAFDLRGQIQQIVLNQASQLAHRFLTAFQSLLSTTHVVINVGETLLKIAAIFIRGGGLQCHKDLGK
jgi:hypothetical protein